ncbi:Zinc-activated ligand-gated ion channel [Varanus komodoensis]|nr:Zinc-activated ligand-gated ion channel [Varanus komodoensis]
MILKVTWDLTDPGQSRCRALWTKKAGKVATPKTTWQNSSTPLGKNLVKSLLDSYNIYQIPRNGSNPLVVNISVVMSNVLNVSWYNEGLVWDEAEFPFSTITVPWNSVWTPSHTVQEAFDIEWKTESPGVVLHSDGKAEFPLALRIDSNCNFDLFYYPRDGTRCLLSFFSLANKVSELEFKVSIENEILNVKREYLVMGVNVVSQKNRPQPYFAVMINLEHTGMRTILSLIVPSIALVVAALCGFLIPLQDRLPYMITLLLAYLVFHSSLVGSLPGSSSCNPLISYYYTGLMVLLFLSTIETVLVTKLVADINLWQSYSFLGKKAKITVTLPEDQSYHPEDTKKHVMSDGGAGDESLYRKKASAALDRLFFITFLGLVVLFHFLFTILWFFWKCSSEKSRGEDHLEGVKWGPDG